MLFWSEPSAFITQIWPGPLMHTPVHCANPIFAPAGDHWGSRQARAPARRAARRLLALPLRNEVSRSSCKPTRALPSTSGQQHDKPKPLSKQLEEIGSRLAWVRDYR
jgi:hypothetical protein